MIPPANFRRAHPSVPAGTWSDDGAQALCLLESLLIKGELDIDDLARRLLRWLDQGYLMPDGYTFDCGVQTHWALQRFRTGTPAAECGGAAERHNGNGSLMRVLPLALWHQGDDAHVVRDAHLQSVITHAHPRAQVCCAFYCLWVRQILLFGVRDGWDA